MQKSRTLFFILLLITGTAHADDTPPASPDQKRFDLQIDPLNIGYTSYYGLILGAKTALSVNLDSHWAWKLGGSFSESTRFNQSSYSLFTGSQYNFSEDHARSFFVGLGIGYGDLLYYGQDDYRAGYYGYVEAGKRWALNKSGTWSFSPYLSIRSDGHGASLSVQPISFTFSF